MNQLLVWKKKEQRFGPLLLKGYSGEIPLFTIEYGVTYSDKGNYMLSTTLGSLSNDRGSEEELKERAEKVFAKWLNKAGLMKSVLKN